MRGRWAKTTLILSGVCLVSFTQNIVPTEKLRANSQRIEQRILKLAEFGKSSTGNQRVAFSNADIQGREYIMSLMKEAGLTVRIDAAGNITGRREGTDSTLPPILFGSHIDCVPNGGNYDGDVGVIGAIECAQVLFENKVSTRHPLEVVVFADEEGGLVGSRGMIGELPEEAMSVVTHSGRTVREGIRFVGGNPENIKDAARKKADVKAFIELHIEQGGTLDAEKVSIGIVEGIVGINWWNVTVEGFANHAGTTPMNKRKDALVAASQYVLVVNKVVTGIPGRHVGTVGRINAEPGALNVVPGKVTTSLELRDLSADRIHQLFEMIQAEVKTIERNTGTKFTFTLIEPTSVPAPTDKQMRSIIAESARMLGLTLKHMPSGAGHDAQDLTRIAPAGMIFVPSAGGISHSPKEFSKQQDMANGANVLLQTILRIDGDALDK